MGSSPPKTFVFLWENPRKICKETNASQIPAGPFGKENMEPFYGKKQWKTHPACDIHLLVNSFLQGETL